MLRGSGSLRKSVYNQNEKGTKAYFNFVHPIYTVNKGINNFSWLLQTKRCYVLVGAKNHW